MNETQRSGPTAMLTFNLQSFDDGPYEITRELLAFLKTIDVKVTFFVVGKQVTAWPEILKEAYDQGHEIGIHTW